MHRRFLLRLLLVPCLLLAVSGCGAPATPAVKPEVRIVSPATESTLRMNPRVAGPINVTVRLAVSHFTLGGSDQIQLYENGKLWDVLVSNSISLSLVPGTYLFKATLVKSGKVVATSAPSAVSVVNALVPTTILSTVGCGTPSAAVANTQPPNTASIRLTCLPPSTRIGSLALSGSGDMWFSGSASSRPFVGTVNPAGVVTVFTKGLPKSGVVFLKSGSGADMWFTTIPNAGYGPGYAGFGMITPSGTVTMFNRYVLSLTAGSGGNMWFDSQGDVGKVSPSGVVQVFTKGLPANMWINPLVPGKVGDMWFGYLGGIGKVSPSGVVQVFTKDLPVNMWTNSLAPGPSGDMWFSGNANSGSFVGKIAPSGAIRMFSMPGGTTLPGGPSPGPDGKMWLYGLGTNNTISIDQITPSGTSSVLTWGLPSGYTLSSRDRPLLGFRGAVWFVGSRSNGASFIGRLSLTLNATAVP